MEASYFNSVSTPCIFKGKILALVIFQVNFYACSLDAFHLHTDQEQHTLISERSGEDSVTNTHLIEWGPSWKLVKEI